MTLPKANKHEKDVDLLIKKITKSDILWQPAEKRALMLKGNLD